MELSKGRSVETLNGYNGMTLMYELIFTVCSIVQGAHCRDLSPMPLDVGSQAIACAIASQVEGAKWITGHPNFYIERATCQPAGRFAKM